MKFNRLVGIVLVVASVQPANAFHWGNVAGICFVVTGMKLAWEGFRIQPAMCISTVGRLTTIDIDEDVDLSDFDGEITAVGGGSVIHIKQGVKFSKKEPSQSLTYWQRVTPSVSNIALGFGSMLFGTLIIFKSNPQAN